MLGNFTSPKALALWSTVQYIVQRVIEAAEPASIVKQKALEAVSFQNFIGNETDLENAKEATRFIESLCEQDDRLLSALPENVEDIPLAVARGSDSFSVPDHIRSIEWLKENGKCLDNIKPGPSTLMGAGRGAFATRSIEKGSLIAPLPVVHLFRKHLVVFDGNDIEDREGKFWKDGSQLILNYCYSHPDSNVLLFPYAPVVNYINHNKTRVNSRLQWSKHPHHRSEWLSRSPIELEKETHAGLLMELVATRDIQPGEEVFLDYGTEWEEAWSEHLRTWAPLREEADFVEHEVLNANYAPVKTQEELENDPYPPNIFTECLTSRSYLKLLRKGSGIRKYEFIGRNEIDEEPDDVEYVECEVIARHEDDSLESLHRETSIRPFEETFDVILELPGIGEARVNGVPRATIRFADTPYSSDMFIRNAFRHEIHIPGDIFPDSWRDQKKSASGKSSPK